MIRTLCLLSFHFSNCILTLFCICSQLVFVWSLPNHIPNTFTLFFTSWCICGWLMVSGLPIFSISVSSIRCNNNIRSIHIPNTHKNTKLFQHADNCSIISTDISEYDDLIKEFKNFRQVSGSRINEKKTEILKIGNPDTINHPHMGYVCF
jgi:hypothetical protein